MAVNCPDQHLSYYFSAQKISRAGVQRIITYKKDVCCMFLPLETLKFVLCVKFHQDSYLMASTSDHIYFVVSLGKIN